MLPPVGGEGRGGSGVTGQPPVHVTWVAAPWCRRVTPPSEPGSDPDPSPGCAPKGCCPGPPAFCPKAQKLGKDSGPRDGGRTQSKGQGSSDSTRSQAAEAQCRPSPGLPPPASRASRARSPAHWPLPFAAASPLLIDKQPGLHRATRRPGARGPDGAICHTRLPATVPAHTLTLIVGARSGSACAQGAEPCLPPGSYPGVRTGVMELLTI